MNTFTFVCENAGVPKLKKVPVQRLSRLKNPRLVFVRDGVELHAQIAYRSGDWKLASDGGLFDVFPLSCLPGLMKLSKAMEA